MGRDWFFPFKEAHLSAYLLQGAISLRMSWAMSDQGITQERDMTSKPDDEREEGTNEGQAPISSRVKAQKGMEF